MGPLGPLAWAEARRRAGAGPQAAARAEDAGEEPWRDRAGEGEPARPAPRQASPALGGRGRGSALSPWVAL